MSRLRRWGGQGRAGSISRDSCISWFNAFVFSAFFAAETFSYADLKFHATGINKTAATIASGGWMMKRV